MKIAAEDCPVLLAVIGEELIQLGVRRSRIVDQQLGIAEGCLGDVPGTCLSRHRVIGGLDLLRSVVD
jgi:hypothetical protein